MAKCDIHGKEMDQFTKKKNVPYHWKEEGVKELDNICYGNDRKYPILDSSPESTPEPKPVVVSDPDKMTKGDWADKEAKKSAEIRRSLIFKKFAGDSMSPAQAEKSGYMREWEHYLETGEAKSFGENGEEFEED